MSLSYRLYQTELRLAAREQRVNDLQILLKLAEAREDSLMLQNDGLSDRIHLDLDPRIVRLAEQLGLALNENKRLGCKLDQAEFDAGKARARYIKRLAQLACSNGELNEKLDNITEEAMR